MKIKQLKNLTDKVRKFKKYEPPQPRERTLPPTYNIILSSSPKGSGKTYNIVNLLTNYENSGFINSKGQDVKMRTIWISGGTSRSLQNSILDTLESLNDNDRIDVEDNLESKIKEIYEDVKNERNLINAYNTYRKTYEKFIKSKSLVKMSLEELSLLNFKNYIDPDEDPDAPKDENDNILYNPRMVFLVLDDLINNEGLSNNKRNNFINRLAVKSRHESDDLVGINLIFISQSFKSIPAVIRKQTDIFILLKSASRQYIIDAIGDEIGSHFTKEEIKEYYDDIMKVDYGSLILSIHKKELPENRVRMGWTNAVQRDKKYLL